VNQAANYAVIGNPIAHSKSPDIHARFAQQTGQNISYERLLAPLDGFAACVRQFIAEGGRGANVTVPFKLEAFSLSITLSERARAAGAVNTLMFDDGGVSGDNTDGVGLVRDIVHNAGVPLEGARILLLGAGGASRGVLLPLLEEKPEVIVIANRTEAKAIDLAKAFSISGKVTASEFSKLAGDFDVIVNATSASLAGDLPPLPESIFSGTTLAYDMMYGAQPTVFMKFAAQRGARTRDGLGMLVEQAAESFFIWRGVRPATRDVYEALRAAL
jgi:shikimate dehydrogenase